MQGFDLHGLDLIDLIERPRLCEVGLAGIGKVRGTREQYFFALPHDEAAGFRRGAEQACLCEWNLLRFEHERCCFSASLMRHADFLPHIEVCGLRRELVAAQGFEKTMQQHGERGQFARVRGFEIKLAQQLPPARWHLPQRDERTLALPQQHTILRETRQWRRLTHEQPLPVQSFNQRMRLGDDASFEIRRRCLRPGLEKAAVSLLRQRQIRRHHCCHQVRLTRNTNDAHMRVAAEHFRQRGRRGVQRTEREHLRQRTHQRQLVVELERVSAELKDEFLDITGRKRAGECLSLIRAELERLPGRFGTASRGAPLPLLRTAAVIFHQRVPDPLAVFLLHGHTGPASIVRFLPHGNDLGRELRRSWQGMIGDEHHHALRPHQSTCHA